MINWYGGKMGMTNKKKFNTKKMVELAIFIAIIVLGHWMLNNMAEYMIGLWSDFSIYIR